MGYLRQVRLSKRAHAAVQDSGRAGCPSAVTHQPCDHPYCPASVRLEDPGPGPGSAGASLLGHPGRGRVCAAGGMGQGSSGASLL